MNRTITLRKWYDDSIFIKDRNEKQYNAQWNKPKQEGEITMNLVEQLKLEIMERYGLEEKDIHINLDVMVGDKDLGRDILNDYNRSEVHLYEPFEMHPKCAGVFSESFHKVTAFLKDGEV